MSSIINGNALLPVVPPTEADVNLSFVFPHVIVADNFDGAIDEIQTITVKSVDAIYKSKKPLTLQLINKGLNYGAADSELDFQFADANNNIISEREVLAAIIKEAVDEIYYFTPGTNELPALTLVTQAFGNQLKYYSEEQKVSNILFEVKRVLSLMLTNRETALLASSIKTDLNVDPNVTPIEVTSDLGVIGKIADQLFALRGSNGSHVEAVDASGVPLAKQLYVEEYLLNYVNLNDSEHVFSGDITKKAATQVVFLVQSDIKISNYIGSAEIGAKPTYGYDAVKASSTSDQITNRMTLATTQFTFALVFDLAYNLTVVDSSMAAVITADTGVTPDYMSTGQQSETLAAAALLVAAQVELAAKIVMAQSELAVGELVLVEANSVLAAATGDVAIASATLAAASALASRDALLQAVAELVATVSV
jgi:hypothetical protein